MISTLTVDSLTHLNAVDAKPCLSLYQPTHRHRPDNRQDPIRFHNLLQQLETSLRQTCSVAETRAHLAPLQALLEDPAFWNRTLDGLAVFAAPEFFRVFRLQRSVPELAIAADSFHTKPLRRLMQSVDRYQVLGLSRGKCQLFEGNRDHLDQIELAPAVPATLVDALGEELTESHQTASPQGGPGGSNGAIHHGGGGGGRRDELDVDTERYFRAVDRAVLEHHSKPSGLPLILAALPEHHHLFRQVSHNPFLMEAGLSANPEGLALDELRQRVWDVAQPQHRARQLAWADSYSKAKAKGLGADNLAQVAQAAAEGRVATLLIESGRQIAGRLQGDSGRIERADLNHPQVDDLLDDLGELVEKMGGDVHTLPSALMPASSGLAATYRH